MSDVSGSQSRMVVVPETRFDAFSSRPSVRRSAPYSNGGKRLLDLVLVLISLPVTGLVILICAALVALDGGRPFYTQKRVGRGGKIFRMWKLRTMVPDAQAILATHLEENPGARSEWHEKQKLSADPRITRFGKFLRKSSLDELPQIFNVLLGDMSLVGPRPMMPEQRDRYAGAYYFLLRPGITGSWQTSARNASSFTERARYDDSYGQTLSLGGDIGLMVRTLGVLARGTGM